MDIAATVLLKALELSAGAMRPDFVEAQPAPPGLARYLICGHVLDMDVHQRSDRQDVPLLVTSDEKDREDFYNAIELKTVYDALIAPLPPR